MSPQMIRNIVSEWVEQGKIAVVEGSDIFFIAGIDGTIARDDHCAAAAIHCSTRNA